ncbi:hypothetical protein [Acinetobacter pragensis]|uniref:Uncharacterized protein n=1 Tax=Acinetobacter pragensis TaxID=1806892 RepID=A0A151Y6Q5_9GAMM|nr:hypothetical protein [Acinetobacter pragensis]KYQ73715.1 hypothetical protein AZH43_00965 [Acinetobacter pragensis]
MLIDFQHEQQKKFDVLALDILQQPDMYLNFDCISDFYQADWLQQFPKGTVWSVAGLDDGAEQYCIRIEYKMQFLLIDCADNRRSVLYEKSGQQQRNNL